MSSSKELMLRARHLERYRLPFRASISEVWAFLQHAVQCKHSVADVMQLVVSLGVQDLENATTTRPIREHGVWLLLSCLVPLTGGILWREGQDPSDCVAITEWQWTERESA